MSQLADAARQFIGVPFRHRGRTARGLDCVGLGIAAYATCGISVPDFLLYGREPFKDGLVSRMKLALGEPLKVAPVSMGDLHDGDVVLIRYLKDPHHMAIIGSRAYGIAEELTMIHAEGVHGRVLEQRLTPDVVERVTHVFRRPV